MKSPLTRALHLAENVGLIPPGQMRHTFASISLQAGESPQWVAAQMGHTDWTFTARIY